jgi:hypothetical protein
MYLCSIEEYQDAQVKAGDMLSAHERDMLLAPDTPYPTELSELLEAITRFETINKMVCLHCGSPDSQPGCYECSGMSLEDFV